MTGTRAIDVREEWLKLAWATATMAGNLSMRTHGRTAWNSTDWEAACTELDCFRLLYEYLEYT